MQQIANHIQVYGLVEKFTENKYTPYDPNINQDIFDWKSYDKSKLVKGQNGLY